MEAEQSTESGSTGQGKLISSTDECTPFPLNPLALSSLGNQSLFFPNCSHAPEQVKGFKINIIAALYVIRLANQFLYWCGHYF